MKSSWLIHILQDLGVSVCEPFTVVSTTDYLSYSKMYCMRSINILLCGYLFLCNHSFVRYFLKDEPSRENDDSCGSAKPIFIFILLSLSIHGLYTGGLFILSLW